MRFKNGVAPRPLGFGISLIVTSGLAAGTVFAQQTVEVEQVGTKRCYVAGVQTYLKKDVKVRAAPGVRQLDLSFQPNEKCVWEPYRVLTAPNYPAPPAAAIAASQSPRVPPSATPLAPSVPRPMPSAPTGAASAGTAPAASSYASSAPAGSLQRLPEPPIAQQPAPAQQTQQPSLQPQQQRSAPSYGQQSEPPVASPVALARMAAANQAVTPPSEAEAPKMEYQPPAASPNATSFGGAPRQLGSAVPPVSRDSADPWRSQPSTSGSYDPSAASSPGASASGDASPTSQSGAPISLLPQRLMAASAAAPGAGEPVRSGRSDAGQTNTANSFGNASGTRQAYRNDPPPAPRQAQAPVQMAAATGGQARGPSPTPGAAFWAQLASLGSEDKAFSAWATIQGQHPDALANLQPTILPASFDDGRTLFRLRVGPLTRSDAADLCEMVNPCYVTQD